jgi:hypothetical protein
MVWWKIWPFTANGKEMSGFILSWPLRIRRMWYGPSQSAYMQRCPLCDRPCPEGHFHALEDSASHHLCGREHSCLDPTTNQPNLCTCDGVCTINSRLQSTKKEAATMKTFQGKRDKFEYEVKSRQDVKRDVCTKKIPPGKLAHDGACCCTRKPEEHYCAHECPGCKYLCTKPHRHEGRHKMEHGNLDQDTFLANRNEFDLGDRKCALCIARKYWWVIRS